LLEDDGLGFEGQQGTALASQFASQRDGVDAHVRTNFNNHAGKALRVGEELKQRLDFLLATLAVAKE